ncbi:MAG: hypothetical protein Q8P61_02840 [Candidatus Nanopelagicales bacterium]|nr:hypothetical protein [Candidatus Nanopelagicales bacterium]
MRPGRNSIVDLSAPGEWDDQTIADVVEAFDPQLWKILAQEIRQDPNGDLARRTAAQARLCDVTGNGNVWLLLLGRMGLDPELSVIRERRHDQHWP